MGKVTTLKIGRPLPAPLSSSVLFRSALASVVVMVMVMVMRRSKGVVVRVLSIAGSMDFEH